MHTPQPLPFTNEPIIVADIDFARKGDTWALVYVNRDGERIVGLTGLQPDVARRLADTFNDVGQKQRPSLKGHFEIEQQFRE